MDITLLKAHAERAPAHLVDLMRDYLKHPTERNACYAVGYIGATEKCQVLARDDATYWRSFVCHHEAHKEWTPQARAILAELP